LVVEADLQLSLLTNEGRLLRSIHKKVDSSQEAMAKAFDVLDRQGMGYLKHDQFVEGLNRCLLAFGGTTLPKDFPSLEILWAGASSIGPQEGTRRISREAFGLVIRRLKMEVLLPPVQVEPPASPSSRSTVTPGGRDGIGGGVGGSDDTDWDDLPAAPPALGSFGTGLGVRQQTMLKHDQLDEDVVMKVFDFTKHSMYKRDVLENKQRDFFLTKHVPDDIILKWIMASTRRFEEGALFIHFLSPSFSCLLARSRMLTKLTLSTPPFSNPQTRPSLPCYA